MSVAVAVKNRDQIVIAADTKRTFGSGAVSDANFTDLKIRQVGASSRPPGGSTASPR